MLSRRNEIIDTKIDEFCMLFCRSFSDFDVHAEVSCILFARPDAIEQKEEVITDSIFLIFIKGLAVAAALVLAF